MKTNQKVTIYFNDVDINSKPYRVFEGCQSVVLSWKEATEYAEKKISEGEWSQYLIPALTSVETIIEGESDLSEEEEAYINSEDDYSEYHEYCTEQ